MVKNPLICIPSIILSRSSRWLAQDFSGHIPSKQECTIVCHGLQIVILIENFRSITSCMLHKIVQSHIKSRPQDSAVTYQKQNLELLRSNFDITGLKRRVLHYLYHYFLFLQKDKEDQWQENKVHGNKDHIILEPLQWTVGYEVQITAANRLGYSEPTIYEFTMPPKPNIITGKLFLIYYLALIFAPILYQCGFWAWCILNVSFSSHSWLSAVF